MHTNSNTTSDVIFHLWVSGLHSGNMEDVKSITLNSSIFFKYGSLSTLDINNLVTKYQNLKSQSVALTVAQSPCSKKALGWGKSAFSAKIKSWMNALVSVLVAKRSLSASRKAVYKCQPVFYSHKEILYKGQKAA